jgi:hypothetical protein
MAAPGALPTFADARPEALAQRKLAQAIDRSPRMAAQRALGNHPQGSPRMVAQRQQIGSLFGPAAQLEADEEAEEPVQGGLLQGQAMGTFTSPAQRVGQGERQLLRHPGAAGPLQNGILQRSPNFDFTTKFADSSYQSADKSDQTIYALVNKDDDCIYYVGRSIDTATRFSAHCREKGLGKNFEFDKAASGSWTPFETATYEQYYIGLAGGVGVLLNKINALTADKWDWFSTPKGEEQNKNQCTKLKAGHF